MQVGSLPGRGSGEQGRGAVEPSPGADARDVRRRGGECNGWEKEGGMEEKTGVEGGGGGRPGHRLPPCMGESSGEETPLS